MQDFRLLMSSGMRKNVDISTMYKILNKKIMGKIKEKLMHQWIFLVYSLHNVYYRKSILNKNTFDIRLYN